MRRGKFCPKCGKETEVLYKGLCSDCFLKEFNLADKIPEKIVLGTCKVCGNVYLKEGKFSTVEEAIENLLEKILRQKEIRSATYRIGGNSLFLTIEIEFEGLQKKIESEIPIVNKTITCRFCNLQKASYYNVTIQVRVPKNMEEKIVGDIEREIARINKYDNFSFISGINNLKEGVDIMVGSKSAAEHVVNYLKRRYNAKTKISRKLYGLIEGKKSYRDTILVSIGR